MKIIRSWPAWLLCLLLGLSCTVYAAPAESSSSEELMVNREVLLSAAEETPAGEAESDPDPAEAETSPDETEPGETEPEEPGHSHEGFEVRVPGVPATCTGEGQTEGVRCSDCGEWITPPTVIPAPGHQWSDLRCTVCKTYQTLSTPVLQSVTAVSTGVQITWTGDDRSPLYRVYRKAAGDKSWTCIANLTGNKTSGSYIDRKAAGTCNTYTYTVRSALRDGDGKIVFVSKYDTAGKTIQVHAYSGIQCKVCRGYKTLSTPKLTGVQNAATGIKVSWEAVPQAPCYRVFRRIGSGSWSKVGDTTSTSITDTKAVSGTTYNYTVRCLSADKKAYVSSYNKTGLSLIHLSCQTPTLTNGEEGIRISWQKVAGATGYRVYQKVSGSYKRLATINDPNIISYVHTGAVANGTTYTYCMKAMCDSVAGAYKDAVLVRLTAPELLSPINESKTSITMDWTRNAKAGGYQLQYALNAAFTSGAKAVTLSGNTTVTRTLSSLTAGSRYYIRVRAYLKDGEGRTHYSAWSKASAVTAQAPRKIRIGLAYGTSTYMKKFGTAFAGQNVELVAIKKDADVKDYDGLIIHGGVDVHPSLYGGTVQSGRSYNLTLDKNQMALIKKFAEADKPIMGVCRGIQLINVYFGGTVRPIAKHRNAPHYITVKDNCFMFRTYKTDHYVNSMHDMCVDTVGPDMEATVWSKNSNSIEAIQHKTKNIFGFQYHPEFDSSRGKEMLKRFASLCRQ